MQNNSALEKNIKILLLFIVVAYLFSMGVRMYWPIYFSDIDSMSYAGELMINTNDGYYFSTSARDVINGVVAENAQKANAFGVSPGLVLLTAYATKLLPFSLDTISLYLPAIIASLIVIPIILTGKLLGNIVLGFLAALIGSIAWSYYNRTMVGYYDTDMFAVFLQFTIFYSFMEIVYRKTFKSIVIATFLVLIYPYFYPQGMTIVYAMFILLVLYMFAEFKKWIKIDETNTFKETTPMYATVILLSLSLMVTVNIEIRFLFVLVAIFTLLKVRLSKKQLLLISFIFFLGFLYFSNVFTTILTHVTIYADRGLDEGTLQFYQVVQTVREAGAIPFETMANRISGSQVGVILSLIGYLFLVFRHKQFIIALPLIGVGLFSMVGGLRFTVYAVPIAALSFVYLSFIVGEYLFKDNKLAKYVLVVFATFAMLYPNIMHIIGYKVPTVFNKIEVDDLVKLDKMATNKDYTLTWWDYGYPIWYYSNTNTLIDGGKHTHDNYIVSKIMFSTSPQQVANLSRLAIETYVSSNYSIAAGIIFKDKNPNQLLELLKNPEYKLPPKTRDIYLYMPYRMINIFPTISVFGNIDLLTGNKQRQVLFYASPPAKQNGSQVILQNGIVFDTAKGEVYMGNRTLKVHSLDITTYEKDGKLLIQTQPFHPNADLHVIYLKSYNNIVLMDNETYNSAYVQMFMLEKYNKDLFELVVSSIYSKIYKIKK